MTTTPARPVPPEGPHRPHLPVLVRDVMTTPAVAVAPSTTVSEIAFLMLEHGISAVPVVDAAGFVVGMVGEGDLVSRRSAPPHGGGATFEDRVSEHRHHWAIRAAGFTAAQVMTADVVVCRPDEPVGEITRRMLRRDVRSLPVVGDGRLVGIVSLHDIVSLLDRPDAEIRRRVRELLADTLYAPEQHRVEATVENGVVVLSGTVRYPQDIGVVTALVSQLPGVLQVEDHLEARESDPVFHFPLDTDWR